MTVPEDTAERLEGPLIRLGRHDVDVVEEHEWLRVGIRCQVGNEHSSARRSGDAPRLNAVGGEDVGKKVGAALLVTRRVRRVYADIPLEELCRLFRKSIKVRVAQ